MNHFKKGLTLVMMIAVLIITGCASETSEASISEQMDYTITGIEPGAGQTELNEQVIEDYDNFEGWSQQTSSTGAMLTELDEAIKNEEPIIVTAWSPHFKFAKYELKYLEDPQKIFGDGEYAGKIARLGFEEDFPIAYQILDRFETDVKTLEQALLRAQEEELEMDVLAEIWYDENKDTLASFTEGLDPVDGKPIEVLTTQWDSELFIAHVQKELLADHGYDVKVTAVDPSILFEAISTGSGDVTFSPWLPNTHGAIYEEYEDQFVDFGVVYEGAKAGLAVPAYMDIDSLEDLEPNTTN